jgi:thioredoxin:protein disulfide reductase
MKDAITTAAAFASLLLLLTASAQTVLPAERVFLYQASVEPGFIVLDWEVVPGHYLYRERFAFSTSTAGIELGEPEYPAGVLHEDEFFGRQEIYRGDFRIRIPYRGQPAAGGLDLRMELQGCAEIGLCYPPQRWPLSVQPASVLPRAGGAAPANR